MKTIEQLESNVRGYSRTYPTVFSNARGSFLYNYKNQRYLDFFSGAGALNYGHNHPKLKKVVLEYISENGLIHGLDMASVAKINFLNEFNDYILKPRKFNYKIQFPGPTGTNAVEAAIRLARKVTNRSLVLGFTNGYHGMTQGALSLTANTYYRDSESGLQNQSTFLPFDNYMGKNVDTLDYIEKLFADPSSGTDIPAAIIVETIQGEGGINVASNSWLQRLRTLTKEYGILLIVDDIQVGCGRTGTFFSFDESGIEPDIVLLSKSLSGFGLPLAAVLIKPEYDQWKAGEHTGTFRCNNLALVAATESLSFWKDPQFYTALQSKSRLIEVALEKWKTKYPEIIVDIRGRGMVFGIEFKDVTFAKQVQTVAFSNHLIIETAGPFDEVLKVLPSLTIENLELQEGLEILQTSIETCIKKKLKKSKEGVSA